jgi:hypothetical protein
MIEGKVLFFKKSFIANSKDNLVSIGNFFITIYFMFFREPSVKLIGRIINQINQ